MPKKHRASLVGLLQLKIPNPTHGMCIAQRLFNFHVKTCVNQIVIFELVEVGKIPKKLNESLSDQPVLVEKVEGVP